MSGGGESVRWPQDLLAKRLTLEARKRLRDEYDVTCSWRRVFNSYHYVSLFLKLTGMYGVGRRTFMNPVVTEGEVFFTSLPESFDGFRILHLSDTHFDLEPRLAEVTARKIAGVDYDVCLFTGDFRDRLTQEGDVGVRLAAEMVVARGRPVYACLGNHDVASDVAFLEECGVRVLVNQSAFIERGDEKLYICGVDDPGYYGTDDFGRAYADVPQGVFSIVLAHDPGAYDKAQPRGASLYLCGHTHAGQMCLPGGYAPATHSRCRRDMVHGLWNYEGMAGYTSSGVGGSRVSARYFSRGEIAIHTLRRRAP